MKLTAELGYSLFDVSRPARGGWIEIRRGGLDSDQRYSPAPHGAGGLKFLGLFCAITKMIVPPRTGRVD